MLLHLLNNDAFYHCSQRQVQQIYTFTLVFPVKECYDKEEAHSKLAVRFELFIHGADYVIYRAAPVDIDIGGFP